MPSILHSLAGHTSGGINRTILEGMNTCIQVLRHSDSAATVIKSRGRLNFFKKKQKMHNLIQTKSFRLFLCRIHYDNDDVSREVLQQSELRVEARPVKTHYYNLFLKKTELRAEVRPIPFVLLFQ
jgi:hypothetical protein